METRRLTIDMIRDYIKNNIKYFTNEEIIEVKHDKNNKNIQDKPVQKKTLQELMSNDFDTIKINPSFFPNLFSNDLIGNFLILNPLHGIVFNKDVNLNTISFYYSVLCSLENIPEENKYKQYLSLMNYLKKDIMIDGFKQHKYSKLKWNKNQIYKNFEKDTIDDKVIRYVSDALHINIFYIKNDKIYYAGGEFIVFKKIVFLLNYNDRYYLICDKLNKSYYFNSDEYIKSFLTDSKNINLVFEEKFSPVGSALSKKKSDIDKKEVEFTDKLVEYTDKLNGYDIENTEDENIENNENNEDDEINESLSLIELQKKARDNNIDIFCYISGIRKIKNKKQLCIEILNKKKS